MNEKSPSLYATIDQEAIRAAWEISPKASAQDWQDWLRRVTRVLIKNAHCTAIRACSKVAELHVPTAKELFQVAFVTSWPGETMVVYLFIYFLLPRPILNFPYYK